MSDLKQMESPFLNDPFSLVWEAFHNLYPNKECKIYYDQHEETDQSDESKEYGSTLFPDDGSIPIVNIFAEYPVNILVEILAHELAHVAVGPGHEHDEAWKDAFDNIYQEYNNLGISRYCKEE